MEKEIIIEPGVKLDDAIKRLLDAKAKGEEVYCLFNEVELHSKDVTPDSAYKAVFGVTRDEYFKKRAEYTAKFKKEFGWETPVEIQPGTNIAEVEKMLLDAKAKGDQIVVVFNGKELHSKDMKKDYVYNQVFGVTKKEFEEQQSKNLNSVLEEMEQDKKRSQEFESKLNDINKDNKPIISYQTIIDGIKYICEHKNASQEELFEGLVNLGCTFTLEDVKAQFKQEVKLFDGIKTGDLSCGAYTIINARDTSFGRTYVNECFLSNDGIGSLYNYIRMITGDMSYTKDRVDELSRGR